MDRKPSTDSGPDNKALPGHLSCERLNPVAGGDSAIGDTLLRLARGAITHHLGQSNSVDIPAYAWLSQRGATFVTLTEHGALRGCIGSVRAQRALGDDVVANAVAAASQDPRFPPVRADELPKIRIEVSLLSEPDFLRFDNESDLAAQLKPGEHGVILFSGCRSATFLPQVWDQLPTPEAFLSALKQKAGLDPLRPAPNLMAAIYTVTKWSEDEDTTHPPPAQRGSD